MDPKVSQIMSSMSSQPHSEATAELKIEERVTFLRTIASQTDIIASQADTIAKLTEELRELRRYKQEKEELAQHLSEQENYGKANEENAGQPLGEWDSTMYIEWYKGWLKPKVAPEQRTSWGPLLRPYVAAVEAGLEEKLSFDAFVKRYEVKITDSTYSDWTKNYFSMKFKLDKHGKPETDENGNLIVLPPSDCKFLYMECDLKYWWHKFHVPKEEITEIIDGLSRRHLL